MKSRIKPLSKNIDTVVRIGSRPSPLAVSQVHEVLGLLSKKGIVFPHLLVSIHTHGDRDKKTHLTSKVSDDFFTDAIDQALIRGRIDVAVHSAKDLPQSMDPRLQIVALTPCLDETDAWVGHTSFERLPAGAKVGTSSFLRQDAIKALRPDLKMVPVRGTIQERIKLVDDGKIDGIIAATCALKRLGLEHRIRCILPWEGAPLQGQLAVVCRRGDLRIKKIFEALDVRLNYGKVYLVGAGPGDIKLITVKAIEALTKAHCVFYDFLVDPAVLKYAPGADHIYVGKRKGGHAVSQPVLSRQIRNQATSGKCVVRLKGGDPLIFGRGADEINYLRSFGIRTEVIPGVSSATGIPSSLGIPLTARGISSSVAFVSAHGEDEKAHRIKDVHIPDAQTIVILMGLSKLARIIKALRKRGWSGDVPAAIISRGTRPDELVLVGTIATIERMARKSAVEPPALIIIGQTVGLYHPAQKSENVLFLGTHPEAYRSLGNLIHFPMIRIIPVTFTRSQRLKIIDQLKRSDIILMTSEYAVEHFFSFLKKCKAGGSLIKDKDFAVIGSHTAQALLDQGIHPKLIATEQTSQGMFKMMKRQMILKGKTIFFPRSSLPNPYLKTELVKAGAKVNQVAIYQNIKSSKKNLPKQDIQSVVFTSPSTVNAFIGDHGKIPSSWEILCKGPVTQLALLKHGYRARIIDI